MLLIPSVTEDRYECGVGEIRSANEPGGMRLATIQECINLNLTIALIATLKRLERSDARLHVETTCRSRRDFGGDITMWARTLHLTSGTQWKWQNYQHLRTYKKHILHKVGVHEQSVDLPLNQFLDTLKSLMDTYNISRIYTIDTNHVFLQSIHIAHIL